MPSRFVVLPSLPASDPLDLDFTSSALFPQTFCDTTSPLITMQSETVATPVTMDTHDSMMQHCSLPGIGKPLNSVTRTHAVAFEDGQMSERYRFPTAVIEWAGRCLTVREHAMISMMSQLVEKPDWESKVFNEEIVKRWRLEALGFTKQMFSFVRETAHPSCGTRADFDSV